MTCHLQQMLKSKRKLCFRQMFQEVDRRHGIKGSHLSGKLRAQEVELQKGQILMVRESRQMLRKMNGIKAVINSNAEKLSEQLFLASKQLDHIAVGITNIELLPIAASRTRTAYNFNTMRPKMSLRTNQVFNFKGDMGGMTISQIILVISTRCLCCASLFRLPKEVNFGIAFRKPYRA
jgi:hypothetical protein